MRGRTKGVRNPDYEEKRRALAAAMITVVTRDEPPSLQKLAQAAGVSVPTVRHYFDDRSGALAAALAEVGLQGKPHTFRLAHVEGSDPKLVLETALGMFLEGWQKYGVGEVFEHSLSLGLAEATAPEDATVGPSVVDHLLEPTIDALETLLARLVDEGALEADIDVRHAALSLLSPVLVALLHQDGLGGKKCRPLDVDAFVASHIKRFIRAYGSLPAE